MSDPISASMSKSQRLRKAMEAVSSGDGQTFSDLLLGDEVVWHWPGRSSVAGDYRGRDAVLQLVRKFHEVAANTLHVEPLNILEGHDYLMSFTHVTAERDGEALDVVMADAMRFGADGRVVEFWTLSNDQGAVDAFIG